MQTHWFDELSKALGARASRRRVAGRLAGGGMAAFLAGAGLRRSAAARDAAATGGTPSPSSARIVRTLVYQELSAFKSGPNDGGEEAPLLGGDGRTIVFARAPGAPDPAQPNRRISHIFVVGADGTNQHEVDAYPQLCYCGAAIDVSADGRAVVSTDSVQLRIADANGTTGRQLLVLDSNELNAARLSGDGRAVYFRLRRDTTRVDSSPQQSLPRGIWAINTDGSGLRQIVGPAQLAALLSVPVAKIPVALDTDFGLAVSDDGSRLVFAAYHPQARGLAEGLFAVNGDGSGLRELVGPIAAIGGAAISADGATVTYAVADAAGRHEAGVVGFAGGGRRPLTSSVVASGDRLQLSGDGRWLLLGSTGLIYRTDGRDVVQLAARPCCSGDSAPLVGDGLFRATMDRTARRFLYLAGDRAGVRQLARLDLDPGDPGAAPRVTDVTIAPPEVPQGGAKAATLTARVAAPTAVAVRSAVLLGEGMHGGTGETEVSDAHVAAPPLFDDGSHGDARARDGVFTTGDLRADCCAVLGPRQVRVLAEDVGSDGKRHAMAVDAVPFAVVAATGATPPP